MGSTHSCAMYIDDMHISVLVHSLVSQVISKPGIKLILCASDDVYQMAVKGITIPPNSVQHMNAIEYIRLYRDGTVGAIKESLNELLRVGKSLGFEKLVIAADTFLVSQLVPLGLLRMVEKVVDEVINGLPVEVKCLYRMDHGELMECGIETHEEFSSVLYSQ